MILQYDQYILHEDNPLNITVTIPNDSLVVKVPWTKFGAILTRYKNTKNPDGVFGDEYCSDYYIAFRVNDADRKSYVDGLSGILYGTFNHIFITHGKNDTILLFRLSSCEITTPNIQLHTLDELNDMLRLEDQFYREVEKCSSKFDCKLEELKAHMNDYTTDELRRVVVELEKLANIDTYYYHPIRLEEEGFWTQIVGVEHAFRFSGRDMNDIIYHDVMDIGDLCEGVENWNTKEMHHQNLDMKEVYYQRISNIINQTNIK